ncbi:putative peptidoglycan glycosyltransferase FtsW [Candidatus Liberibacter asiaticus]|uniref:Probable peptidoglycan glycosyltransferase FtsW n=2 Tax=Liberibacter asiaticus TaxID=34021 RepID=C6XGR8_LIBAP|nr:putative peptidoglycan glycosyltransferase FtsW [Candidatus Liberibacter asiaticus]ACT57571.1 cell division protein FtsW peptidoglycan synthesis [Candidatus Liberibacter asiaticus str. psy62]AGH17334.1 cell division protein FtsW [Candidatus Liberibacter asiaticus str. gxpsy]ALK07618.1 cell division protein FtsW [Candidatus Liberibacter asiaticus]ASK53109.1 cell division protein FtsW [Candidatus Liberibacter asiaticus]AWL14434.1 cell division protein FtsW [Candidatus Liberibacter asiaticus]
MVKRAERGILAEWFWTVDWFSLIAFLFLLGLGLMLSFASSPSVAEKLGLENFYFVKRHALFLIPSVIIMISFSLFSPKNVKNTAFILLFLSLIAMFLTLFWGVEIKGAKRWLYIAGTSVQPSEFMKPSFIIVSAWFFAEQIRHPEIPGNIFSFILFGIVIALLIAQPDFGQSILVSLIWDCMFFITGISWLWIVVFAFLGLMSLFIAYQTMPHVAIRINHFMTGVGDSFQIDSSRDAIIHGGWFGKGPGEGVIKRVIPDSHTDFVFSVAAEEFGIIFCIFILCIFAFIVVRSFLYSLVESNDFIRMAIFGLALQIALQAFINIGVNLHLLPTKGMTMPAISYGGSSILGICITMGYLLALTCRRPEKRAYEEDFMHTSISHSSGS